MSASLSLEELLSQYGQNAGYVKDLYERFLFDPSLVGASWEKVFRSLSGIAEQWGKGETNGHTGVNGHNGHATSLLGGAEAIQRTTRASSPSPEEERLFAKVMQFIESFRNWGHFNAKINPLSQGIVELPKTTALSPETFGLSASTLEQAEVFADGILGKERMSFAELHGALIDIYCSTVGFEWTYVINDEERAWLRSEIETLSSPERKLSAQERKYGAELLLETELFESECHKRYVGVKRFSCEGSESLLSAMGIILQKAAEGGTEEAVLGMAHRGRLATLVNILQKPLHEMLYEFEDRSDAAVGGAGDVKYHLGYEGPVTLGSKKASQDGKTIRAALMSNPSHLEFVDAVVEGYVRARQDSIFGGDRSKVLPLLIHGDAAVIGQGIVAETLGFANVGAYTTGGTIHIAVNNQIGFTTTPDEARSSPYCTDFAKSIGAPVFHVNAEDVDAVLWTALLALRYRQRFGKDVFIDLIGYRKYGHNEGDDPTFTQPHLYEEIRRKETIASQYWKKLIAEGVATEEERTTLIEEYKNHFSQAQGRASSRVLGTGCAWYLPIKEHEGETGIGTERITALAEELLQYPSWFVPHTKLSQILEKRMKAALEGKPLEWGVGEALAYASLLEEGVSLRMSGQDVGRGTFSHRHAVLDNLSTEEGVSRTYMPLSKAAARGNARCQIHNSTLSENGVMGFEYGYSLASPKELVIWEAQFGDFVNGAQVIIDQFLSSSQTKWGISSGLVLLLPHGFEGQGPEHSSARLERFLQLCAEENIRVAYPTSTAQCFHLLRKQGLSEHKRPLVVMSPKSLLRSPAAMSSRGELEKGRFQEVLVTSFGEKKSKKHSLVLCSGKIGYEVINALQSHSGDEVKVIRLEQLYPFPAEVLKKIVGEKTVAKAVWVQEEPRNMGGWSFVEPYLREIEGLSSVKYCGRALRASPACGSHRYHHEEQHHIINEVQKLVVG